MCAVLAKWGASGLEGYRSVLTLWKDQPPLCIRRLGRKVVGGLTCASQREPYGCMCSNDMDAAIAEQTKVADF